MALFYATRTLENTAWSLYQTAPQQPTSLRVEVAGRAVWVQKCILDIRFDQSYIQNVLAAEDVPNADISTDATAAALHSALMCGQVAAQTGFEQLRPIIEFCETHRPKGLDQFERDIRSYVNRMERMAKTF